MFAELSSNKKQYYKKMLSTIGSLSRLFSETDIPYVDYRIAENIYCKAFESRNVSRDDSAIDAVLGSVGIGIKTFQGSSSQKIAEFDKDRELFANLSTEKCINKISELRNKRIEFAKNNYGITRTIYHCVKRVKGKIIILEYPMDTINISGVDRVQKNKNTIIFTDGLHEYSFNISKSVLMMKFPDTTPLMEIDVKILDDPLEIINQKISELIDRTAQSKLPKQIFLPLYTMKQGQKTVPESSGLNQWHARGRTRDPDEVYIRIPSWINTKYTGFFPARNTIFSLKLPNNRIIQAKVCQDGNKALMSNPNSLLGKWILRDILKMKRNKLATYEKLKVLGIDSVKIIKLSNTEYSIDFAEENSFDSFEKENA